MPAQNPIWPQTWKHPTGLVNPPIGTIPQPQQTLQTPFQLPPNSQTLASPQLSA